MTRKVKDINEEIQETPVEEVKEETKEYQQVVDGDYIFYSKLLKKPFETVKELRDAEYEYYKEHEEEIKKTNEKKALAKKVEDAYKKYLEVLEDGQKRIGSIHQEIDEAKNEYINAKNEFIDTYGSFHMTYVDKEPKVDTSDNFVSTFFDSLNESTSLLSRFFED